MKELLPCPFCGESDMALHPDAPSGVMQMICKKCHARGPGIFVIGMGTTALLDMDKILATSIDFWNTRAPQILELTARVLGNTIELSGVPQVTGSVSISWKLAGEVDNA